MRALPLVIACKLRYILHHVAPHAHKTHASRKIVNRVHPLIRLARDTEQSVEFPREFGECS